MRLGSFGLDPKEMNDMILKEVEELLQKIESAHKKSLADLVAWEMWKKSPIGIKTFKLKDGLVKDSLVLLAVTIVVSAINF